MKRAIVIFEFYKGPIFGQLILADEINRASPKTQSALLEAMQEEVVTVFGTPYALQPPFYGAGHAGTRLKWKAHIRYQRLRLTVSSLSLKLPYPAHEELREIIDKTTQDYHRN